MSAAPESGKMEANPEFYMQVGLCITAWAGIEEQLFRICLSILNTTELRAAIIYYRTPTLDARLKLIDELIHSTIPPPKRKNGGHPHRDMKRWDKMRLEIEKNLGLRRRIAHHPVTPRHALNVRVTKEMWGELIKRLTIDAMGTSSWFEIYASEAERLRGRDAGLTPLKIADLSDHCAALQELAANLSRFVSDRLPTHLK